MRWPRKRNLQTGKYKTTTSENQYCSWMIQMVGYTGCFIMFSIITNIYNKKTKGPTLMEFFTATGK